MNARIITTVLLSVSTVLIPLGVAVGQIQSITAGANLLIDFNQQVDVSFDAENQQYSLEANLIHEPGAGPMIKVFPAPTHLDGLNLELHADQPLPLPVWEDFHLLPDFDAFRNTPVSDWHEEILTEGWEWVLPTDATRFPDLFPPGTSLITKNGEPHPWHIPPLPAVHEPHKLWVEFPAILPGETLDIHKALLWTGTPGNTIWGDNVSDDGQFVDERFIHVWEYPTPEPATCTLMVLAMLCAGCCRRH